MLVPECKVSAKDGRLSGMVKWLEGVEAVGSAGESASGGNGGDVLPGAAATVHAHRSGLFVLNLSNKHSWMRSNSVVYSLKLVRRGEEE